MLSILNSFNLTHKEFIEIDECKCGGPVFKFINTSKNISIIKCGYITHEYDTKKKEMIKSKRQPCNYYRSTKPEILNTSQKHLTNVNKNIPCIENITENMQNMNINKKETNKIEKELLLLFNYLLISKKVSTLQQINNIVKNKLNRKINTNYSNDPKLETYEDYKTRIFSRPIIQRDPVIIIKKKEDINYCSSVLKNIQNIIKNTKIDFEKIQNKKNKSKNNQINKILESLDNDYDETSDLSDSEKSQTCSIDSVDSEVSDKESKGSKININDFIDDIADNEDVDDFNDDNYYDESD